MFPFCSISTNSTMEIIVSSSRRLFASFLVWAREQSAMWAFRLEPYWKCFLHCGYPGHTHRIGIVPWYEVRSLKSDQAGLKALFMWLLWLYDQWCALWTWKKWKISENYLEWMQNFACLISDTTLACFSHHLWSQRSIKPPTILHILFSPMATKHWWRIDPQWISNEVHTFFSRLNH